MTRRSHLFLFSALVSSFLILNAVPAVAQFEVRAKTGLGTEEDDIAVADFNCDGKLDVAVAGNQLFIFLGNGDGTFQKPVIYPITGLVVASADFNGDRIPDLALSTFGSNSITVLLGKGDGTFEEPTFDFTTADPVSYITVADINNDQKVDLVVIDGAFISVLLGNGDGTFRPPFDDDSFPGPHELVVGDFNNDHKLDVAVVGYSFVFSGYGILLGNGDGTLQPAITHPLRIDPIAVVAADFDGDGNTDLAVGQYLTTGLNVFLGKGDGSFQPPVLYDTTAEAFQIVAADLNGDGKLDLAVPTGVPPGATVVWGSGSGTFQLAQVYSSWYSGKLVVGDFNGDGTSDLAMNTFVGVVTMLNTGTAKFTPTTPIAFPVQAVNTASANRTLTLENTGTKPLSIRSLTSTGDFRVTDTCGKSVIAGGTCDIDVVFEPKTVGTLQGRITLRDSASTKPQTILLTGPSSPLAVSPGELDFGNQKVGTASPPRQATVTNTSNATVAIKGIVLGGLNGADFHKNTTCGSQISPGASCTISVTFKPLKTGIRTSDVDTTLTGVPDPTVVVLTGTGA